MRQQPTNIKHDILKRVTWLYILFVLAGIIISARLIYLQFSKEIISHAERLESRIFTKEIIPARRGSILARNGEPLATSVYQYRVMVDFASEGLRERESRYYEECDTLAKMLSAYFGDRTKAEYDSMLHREYRRERDNYTLGERCRDTVLTHPEFEKKGFLGRVWDRILGRATYTTQYYDTIREHKAVALFPRAVDYAEWEQMRRWPLLNWSMGMIYHLEENDTRIYPLGDLARRTIGEKGYYGAPDEKGDTLFGNYGLEDAFRDTLAGRDGQVIRQRFAHGFHGSVAGGDHIEPRNGLDVVTTLDVDLQEVVHNALEKRLRSENATWGTTLVMDVTTGELLAMANLGRRRPGEYGETGLYAMTMTMEPGSTFKLATMLTLLEEARMSPEKLIETHNGKPIDIGPARGIEDDHSGDHKVNMYRAATRSSNVYFAQAIWDTYSANKGRWLVYSNFLRERLHLDSTMGLEYLGEIRPYVTDRWEVDDPTTMLVKMAYGYRVKLAPIHVLTLYNAVANNGRMVAPLLVREIRRGDEVLHTFESRVLDEKIASDENLRIINRALESVCQHPMGTAYAYLGDTTLVRAAGKTGTAQVTAPRKGDKKDMHYLASLVTYFPANNPRYTVLTTIETLKQDKKAYYGAGLAGPVVKEVVEYICKNEKRWLAPLDGPQAYQPSKPKSGDAAALTDTATKSTMPDVCGMGLRDALFMLERCRLKVDFEGHGTVTAQSIAAMTPIKEGQRVTLTLK